MLISVVLISILLFISKIVKEVNIQIRLLFFHHHVLLSVTVSTSIFYLLIYEIMQLYERKNLCYLLMNRTDKLPELRHRSLQPPLGY